MFADFFPFTRIRRMRREWLRISSAQFGDNRSDAHRQIQACFRGVKSIRREFMESHDPTASTSVAPSPTIAVRTFSKVIALTYVGLGFFGLIFLISSLYQLIQAVASRRPLLLIACTAYLSLGIALTYLVFALRERRKWARHAAVSFWLICLIWSVLTIVRNGSHPEPAPGPLQYSNAEQLAGARFAELWTPYFMTILESTAIYCLLRKANIVNQFK